MKIKIEFTSSYTADITIDGKKITYDLIGRNTGLSGIEPDLIENTIGGIIAQKLTSPLRDILQGWLPDEPNPKNCCWDTWEKLSESAQQEVSNAIDV